jgi:serine/threonine protein kinase/predicted negative regulator of RcsB-dependent stress response
MEPSDNIQNKTSNIGRNDPDKSEIKIHNILPSIERTFLQIGSTIGKYCIIEEIDRGGMAVVYKALQLDLDREVALKVLPANITINRRFVERFLSEAHAVAKLQHPYIVNIHEVAVENNVYYLAMDYIPGMNLYYYLNFKKPKLVEVLEITVKLAEALAYAHNQKIIHRDLKLNNIIMRDNATPVLIDFGLAKALEGEQVALTKTGEIMGSPAYMAPERLTGANTDARSDICSLGIMLYEMLTFKNPYLDPRSMPQTTMNVMEANPILPRKLVPWLPAEIEAITLKAMQKDPDKRYQTMEEFGNDIKRYQRGEPVLADPPSVWTNAKRFIRIYWPPLVIGMLIMLFAFLAIFNYYYNKKKEQPYWSLSYIDDSTALIPENGWRLNQGISAADTLQWRRKGKSLLSPSEGYSYIVLEREYSRDLRIEFDIRPSGHNLANAGFFLYGNCPDSGYKFHLFHEPDALCGISYPGGDFIFTDYDPVQFIASDIYHVYIECRGNDITYKINGLTMAEIRDFFRPAGENHKNVGFFVDNTGCAFSNLRIHTFTQPVYRDPCVVADGFAQSGDFSGAIREYKEILPELSNTPLTGNIMLNIAACRIRLGQYDDANKIMETPYLSSSEKGFIPDKRLFFKGVIYNKQNKYAESDSMFVKLFRQSQSSTLCKAAAAIMIEKAVKSIRQGDSTGATSTMDALAHNYFGFTRSCGRAYLAMIEYYLEKGDMEKTEECCEIAIKFYKSDIEVFLLARAALSRVYLANGKKIQAIDLLNQCIAAYVPLEGAWNAWMALAEIYEFDSNFSDAFTIYNKIYSDAPKYLVSPWIARIRMGEIADRVTSEEKPEKIFDDVINSSHQFVLPRQIAQFYRGNISMEEFETWWKYTYPGSKKYLYYFAKNALIKGYSVQAYFYLKEFKQSLAPDTWNALRVNKMLSQLNNN